METKICRDCQQEKPLAEFGRSSATKDGLLIYCRPCRKERDRKTQEKARAKNQGKDPYVLVDGQVRTKSCLKCKQEFPVTEFCRSASEPSL